MGRRQEEGAAMQAEQAGFRETITTSAEAEGRFARQSGGRNQFAVARLKVEPLEEGENLLFVNALADADRLLPDYIQAVEDGVRESAQNGFLADHPIIRVCVTLLDGASHPVDSSVMAFKVAGSMAFKEAIRKAHSVLLEPVMLVTITMPPEFLGKMLDDLKLRRGKVIGTEEQGSRSIIRAQVRQSALLGYEAELRYLTKGQASFTMQFSHYIRVEP
jgi:elongation factor G